MTAMSGEVIKSDSSPKPAAAVCTNGRLTELSSTPAKVSLSALSNTCKISGVSRNSHRNSRVVIAPLDAITTAMPPWAPVDTKLMRRTLAASPSGVVVSATPSVSRASSSAAH